MNLLSRLAPGEHGTNGKPFNYQTLRLADVERVRQTLAELEKAIKAKEPGGYAARSRAKRAAAF